MKNYPRILARVHEEPWAIEPGAHRAIRDLLRAKLTGEDVPVALIDGRDDPAAMSGAASASAGDPYEGLLLLTPEIAFVPVFGVIGKHLSMLETFCGGCDLDTVCFRLDQARSHPTVKRIVMCFDSPGGPVTGVKEAAQFIREVGAVKSIDAYSETCCASAAYELASQARRIVGTPSSRWGSIGIILAWIDRTARMEKEGDAARIFQGGKFKSAGADGKPMAPEEEQMFQAMVDKLYADFKATVTSTRPQVADATMQGQMFFADDAQAAGLVDELVWGLGDLVAEIESELSQA